MGTVSVILLKARGLPMQLITWRLSDLERWNGSSTAAKGIGIITTLARVP